MENLVLIRVAAYLDESLSGAALTEMREEPSHRVRLTFACGESSRSVPVAIHSISVCHDGPFPDSIGAHHGPVLPTQWPALPSDELRRGGLGRRKPAEGDFDLCRERS